MSKLKDKHEMLFRRDAAFHRMGTIMTGGMAIFLLLGIFLMNFSSPEEGLFEGFKLIAFVIIIAAVVIEIAYWIYFIVIHSKVKKLVMEFSLKKIEEDKNFIPFLTADCVLLFKHKDGKKFLLCEKGRPERSLHFSFTEFTSLYDGDVTFYSETAKALAAYIKTAMQKGGRFKNIKLTADYNDKKLGVKDCTILSDGVLNEKLI